MNYYTTKDYLLLATMALGGLFVGWILGASGWGMTGGLMVWITYQHGEYQRFRDWASRPLRRPLFRSDAWSAGADDLYRSLMRGRDRTRETLDRLRDMRGVTEALPDAAVILDGQGRIESFNPAARELLHLATNDIGNRLNSLVRHPDFVALMRGRAPENVIEMLSPIDDEIRLEVRLVTVAENKQLLLARDVTQLNRLLTMRQDFVANVSHELRSPLTVVIGYLETLLDGDAPADEILQVLQKLRSPTQRMQALVDDLLLLTRLEASPHHRPDELETVDMPLVITRVVRDAEAISGGRHSLLTDFAGPGRILGIEKELHSAVSNLVTNAVRYSPDGGEIRVSWKGADSGAVLEVVDQGVGIATEHLSRLTERFYRVDLARARIKGGTGLGLAIVKHVLKRHNSTLEIESELGSGSRFFCQFPASQLVDEPQHHSESRSEPHATSQHRHHVVH